MKKRMACILFSVLAAAGVLSGCSGQEEGAEGVTRGEWIAMLADAFGYDTYRSDTPYYSDITASDPQFSAVQASAEWGVLSIYDGDRLDPGAPVTRDEAASTAAIAAGFEPEADGRFDTRASVDYAVEQGIMDEAGGGCLTAAECEGIIEAAQNLYLTNPGEEKTVVEYADDVVDLRDMSMQPAFVGENEISFPGTLTGADSAAIQLDGRTVQLGAGDTVISSATAEYPAGAAYKIVSVREDGGQVICGVTTPSFGDIYDSVDIHTTVALSDSAIVWADGVEVSPLSRQGRGYQIRLLSDRGSGGHSMDPDAYDYSWNWQMKFNTGAVKLYQDGLPDFLGSGPEVQALEDSNFTYKGTPSLADFNGTLEGWTKELEKLDKYEKGYDITVDLGLQLSALVDISYDKPGQIEQERDLWPQSVSVLIHSNLSADFSLEGDIKEKQLELGKVSFPLGQTGLTIDGTLFLYLEATGQVEVKLEVENTQRTGWNLEEERQGYQAPVRKRPGTWGNSSSAEVSGAVDLAAGTGLELDLSAFSTVKLVGADCKAGGNAEAKGTLTGACSEQTTDGVTTRHYTETIQLGSTLSFPVVTFTVSGPDQLADLLGMEKSWDIVSKEDAMQIPFVAAEWVIWEATTTVGADGVEIVDSAPSTQGWNTYNTRFGTVNAVTYPAFSFDYPENWTVTREEVDPASEWVTLTNERGSTIDFFNIHQENIGGGSGMVYREVEVTKVADAEFVPSYVQATDYSDLGKFMVAEIRTVATMDMMTDTDFVPVENGSVSYAVLPESCAGTHTINSAYFMDLAFWYAGNTIFVASPAQGQFTPEEQAEVIAILSSFRV